MTNQWMESLTDPGRSGEHSKRVYRVDVTGKPWALATNGHCITLVCDDSAQGPTFPAEDHIADWLEKAKDWPRRTVSWERLTTWLEGAEEQYARCQFCDDNGKAPCMECGQSARCHYCDGDQKVKLPALVGLVGTKRVNRRLLRRYLGSLTSAGVEVSGCPSEIEQPIIFTATSGEWIVFLMPMLGDDDGPQLLGKDLQ